MPKGYEAIRFPTGTKETRDIYNQLYQMFPELMRRSQGSPEMFAQMEAPAIQQFQREVAPGIAQRYAGQGISGSSGMQNTLAAAGRDLASDLQAQRQNYLQQSLGNVMNLGNYLLQNPQEQTFYRKKPSWFSSLLGIGAPIAGAGLGSLFGGFPGAQMGSSMGSAFSQGLWG